MGISKKRVCLYFLLSLTVNVGFAQSDTVFSEIPLNSMEAFADPGKNWIIAANATANFLIPQDIKASPGQGAVVNVFSKNSRMHLFTVKEFGDIELELDFMMAKNSNSGVYLQGRYEVQLLDSWTRLNTSASDVGGIYSRWTADRGTFEGTAPAMNVGRAPGLWQHLQIKFRAPRFDNKGQKTRNARFEEVYLNDVLVQQSVNVTGPTGSSMFPDEKALAPLVFQGDHGPVAFKNIRYRSLPPETEVKSISGDQAYWDSRNPILLAPQSKNYLLRSFMEVDNKKLTHVISVGSPTGLNFSYDLKQGALLQVWRGKFLDATRMWVGRGEPQIARPLGSVIFLSGAPTVAFLVDENTPWPDSVAFDDFHQHGYLLNKQRSPAFKYEISGTMVNDSITFETNGESISRALKVDKPAANLYCRLFAGKSIALLRDDLYVVDDSKFYIRVSKKLNPVIRASAKGQEIIVPFNAAEPLLYSIIW